jgi:L-fuconolactonase
VRRASKGNDAPPLSSEEIAQAWRPFFDVCIDRFGAARCMFESNFPVQKRWCSYAVFWNACKRLAAGASVEDKSALFSGSAIKAYRVPVQMVSQ